MLTLDQARVIGDEWHRGTLGQLYRLARTGTVGCRRRMLAEIRAAHRECVATAAMFGPSLIDSPEDQDETAWQECHDQAARLLALAQWTEQQPESCTSPEGCPCPPPSADHHP